MKMVTTEMMAREHFPDELSVVLVAEYLRACGMTSNASYAYGLVSTGAIPSEKKGRRLVVKKCDVDRFVSERMSAAR